MSDMLVNANTPNAAMQDRHVWMNIARVVGVLCGVALALIVVVSALT